MRASGGRDDRTAGFFDLSDRYEALSAAGDPLERLAAVVDFEVFRGPLIAALRRSPRAKGGRPPFDPVLMFKILVLQAFYRSRTMRRSSRSRTALVPAFPGAGARRNGARYDDGVVVRERLKAKAIDKLDTSKNRWRLTAGGDSLPVRDSGGRDGSTAGFL